MKNTTIVAVREADESARDAIALGADLARAAHGELLLVAGWTTLVGRASHLYDEVACEYANNVVEALRADVPADVASSTEVFTAGTIDRGIHDLAEELDAAALVFGPSHLGRFARAVRGDRSVRALEHSPCPVAVAPSGYQNTAGREGDVAVAWDGSPEARAALEHAVALAEARHTSVRVIHVVDPPYRYAQYPWLDPTGEERWLAAMEKGARTSLERACTAVAERVPVSTELRHGSPSSELAEATQDAAMVVVGSRGYGPAWRVIVGSTASGLLHHATVPVLVVPRGARRADASLGGAALAAE